MSSEGAANSRKRGVASGEKKINGASCRNSSDRWFMDSFAAVLEHALAAGSCCGARAVCCVRAVYCIVCVRALRVSDRCTGAHKREQPVGQGG